MSQDHDKSACIFLDGLFRRCRRRGRCSQPAGTGGTPLSEACCDRRVRVCALTGDRKTCARMANLGLLPGSELELLCRGGGQQCMIRINGGGTLSLDAPTAATILVAPAGEQP